MERRTFSAHEVRIGGSDKEKRVVGYAARYEVMSKPLPGFRERIRKNAFKRILEEKPDVVATFNHDMNVVLGRTTSGTLQLHSDDRGLAFDCLLPNTQGARDLYESIQRGDINGCSFAFNVAPGMDEWSQEPDYRMEGDKIAGSKGLVRTLKDFNQLIDVSIVTSPAYPNTSVDARNIVSAEVRSQFERVSKRCLQSFEDILAEQYGELYVANLKRAIHDGTYISLREAQAIARRRNLLNEFLS